MEATIIDQINKFLIKSLSFEFKLKKLGKSKIKTNSKKRAGIISSNPIYQVFQKLLAF